MTGPSPVRHRGEGNMPAGDRDGLQVTTICGDLQRFRALRVQTRFCSCTEAVG